MNIEANRVGADPVHSPGASPSGLVSGPQEVQLEIVQVVAASDRSFKKSPPSFPLPSVLPTGGGRWSCCKPFGTSTNHLLGINLQDCLPVAGHSWFQRGDKVTVEIVVKDASRRVVGWAIEPYAANFLMDDLDSLGIRKNDLVYVSVVGINDDSVRKEQSRLPQQKEQQIERPYIPPATAQKLKNPAQPGGRNIQMTQMAMGLLGNGLYPEAVFVQFRQMFPEDGPEPVSDEEIRKVINWAVSKHPGPSQATGPTKPGAKYPIFARQLQNHINHARILRERPIC
jgi:hypothetical protein